ncbi:MAG: hypothetical protein HKM95_15700, partial [Inquilinus sp.]|nr:hypothetical protein [Inquilinus sp.]
MALTRGFASRRGRTTGDRSPASTFQGGLLLSVVLCLCGLSIGLLLLRIDGDAIRAFPALMMVAMYRAQDTLWFGLLSGILLWLAWVVRDKPAPLTVDLLARWWPDESPPLPRVALGALAVLLVAGAGTYLVQRGVPFSTEEVSNAFQADIFEKGRLLAPLPEAWREFRGALQPYSTVYEA